MILYFLDLNPRVTGEYEVHALGCSRRPARTECIGLGKFSNGQKALMHARSAWPHKQISGLCACLVGCVAEVNYQYQLSQPQATVLNKPLARTI
jgi:hypothetical protein